MYLGEGEVLQGEGAPFLQKARLNSKRMKTRDLEEKIYGCSTRADPHGRETGLDIYCNEISTA